MAFFAEVAGDTLKLYLDVPQEARRGLPSRVTLPMGIAKAMVEELEAEEELAASGAIRPADRTKLGASGGIDTIVSKFPAPGGLADRPELPTQTSKA